MNPVKGRVPGPAEVGPGRQLRFGRLAPIADMPPSRSHFCCHVEHPARKVEPNRPDFPSPTHPEKLSHAITSDQARFRDPHRLPGIHGRRLRGKFVDGKNTRSDEAAQPRDGHARLQGAEGKGKTPLIDLFETTGSRLRASECAGRSATVQPIQPVGRAVGRSRKPPGYGEAVGGDAAQQGAASGHLGPRLMIWAPLRDRRSPPRIARGALARVSSTGSVGATDRERPPETRLDKPARIRIPQTNKAHDGYLGGGSILPAFGVETTTTPEFIMRHEQI